MFIDFLRERFANSAAAPALVWRDREYRYDWLLAEVDNCAAELARHGVPAGSVVSIEADFSPKAIALLLALLEHRAVIVPLTSSRLMNVGDVGKTCTWCRSIAAQIACGLRSSTVTMQPPFARL